MATARRLAKWSCPRNAALDLLIAKSVAWFNALSPMQQKEHREAQRKSWCIGETMLAHPEMTRAEAERLYEEVK